MRQERKFNYVLMFLGLMSVTGNLVCLFPRISQAEEQSLEEAKKIVAKVNGKPIYEEQLKPQVENGLRVFRKYGMRKEDPELVKRLQSRALDKLIGEELIFQESQKLTIEDIDEKVEQKLEALKKKYGTGEEFAKYLKRKNLTMEEARGSLRTSVYVDGYLKEKGISEPKISEERIRETYDRNPDSYSREETIKVSHILIAAEGDAGVEENEQASQKAEEIRKKVLSGKNFAEMAKEHSDCNSASGGGSLGSIKKGYMPQAFDKVAFTMEKGAVSEVVKTKFGYHIIKVSDKKSAGVTPYEEVRDFIEKFLQQQESEKKRAAHMVELKEKAKIEILLNELEGSASRSSRAGASAAIAMSSPKTPSPAIR
jgi:peptidyl-prolyl cis-trans isomerase C